MFSFIGRKLRLEIKAKVPTAIGACPRWSLLGEGRTYGAVPLNGNIDMMTWSYLSGYKYSYSHVQILILIVFFISRPFHIKDSGSVIRIRFSN